MGRDPGQETSIARTKFCRPRIPSAEIKSDFEFIDVLRTKYLFHGDDLILGRLLSVVCIFLRQIKIRTSKIGMVCSFIFKNSFIYVYECVHSCAFVTIYTCRYTSLLSRERKYRHREYRQFEKKSDDRATLLLPIRSSIFAWWKGQRPPCASSINNASHKERTCKLVQPTHCVAPCLHLCSADLCIRSQLILSRVNASGANI